MNFHEAVKAAKDGKKIKRKDWESVFELPDLVLRLVNARTGAAFLSFGEDILAEDWEIVPEQYTFIEMIEMLKAGKRMMRNNGIWNNSIHIQPGSGDIVFVETGYPYELRRIDIDAKDWIEFEK